MSPVFILEIGFLFKTYALPRLRSFFFLTLLTTMVVVAQLIAPILMQLTIDSALTFSQSWVWYSVSFFAVSVIAMIVQVMVTTQTAHLALTIANQLRFDLLRQVIGLGVTYREKTSIGDTIEILEGHVVNLQNILSILGGQVVIQLLVVLGSLMVAFAVHPLAGCGFVAYVALTIILVRSPQILSSGLQEHLSQSQRMAGATLFSLLQARSDLLANRGHLFALRHFSQARGVVVPAHRAAILASVLWFGRASSLLVTTTAFSLLLGGVLHTQGLISLGTVLLLTRLASVMTAPLLELSGNYDELAFSVGSLLPIRQLRLTQQDLPEPEHPMPAPGTAPRVLIDNLSFAYEKNNVLHRIDLEIPANALVGIVGQSGSGKSTLGQLLVRTRDPNAGGILVNGINLKSLSAEDRFRFLYIVDQDQTQLQGTLEENLALYGNICSERLWRAIQILIQLHPPFEDFLKTRMPETLSDGELQLVALARALVSEARLIVLDEVNARLDPQMRQKALHLIAELTQEKTVFLIAHRAESLEICSHIVLLELGKVKAFGFRDHMLELLSQHTEVWT